MRDNHNDLAIMPQKRKFVPHRPKMTIGIGLISKKSPNSESVIVLAADSEMNYEDERKDLMAQKLTAIEFKNARIMTVMAGMAQPALRALQLVQDMAKNIAVESSETIHRVFADAFRMVRNECVLESGKTDEDGQRRYLIEDCDFSMLVGYCIGEKSYLERISLMKCSLWPVENKTFAAIGIGNHLGDYLLKESSLSDPDFALGFQTAVAAVLKIKQNVKGCGGKTQIGLAMPSATGMLCNATTMPDDFVNQLESVVNAHDAILKNKQIEMANAYWGKVWDGFESAWKSTQNKKS